MKNFLNKNIFGKKTSPLNEQLGNLFLYVCIYLVVMMLLFSLMYTAVLVDGTSMENTYHDEDVLYYLPSADYTYGDVIIVEVSKDHEIVKRVVGLEGDRISFDVLNNNGTLVYQLMVNDKVVIEPYIKSIAGNSNTYDNMFGGDIDSLIRKTPEKVNKVSGRYEYVVGADEVFALGDNRGVSVDSSVYGAFSKDQIKGRVDFFVEKDDNTLLSLFKQFFWPF